jgi:hypothetical protein
MMKHREARNLLYEFATGGLSEREHSSVDLHVAGCSTCRSELDRLRSLLKVLPAGSVRPSEKRTGEFWDAFARNVESRIAAGNHHRAAGPSVWEWLASLLLLRPRMVPLVAASLAVFGAAIFSWHMFLSQPNRTEAARRPASGQASERVGQYFRKSKVLLVGLANMRTTGDGSLDLSVEREASRALVHEARELKQRPLDRRSAQLITEMERILIQLATLEETNDLPGVEIIRGGIQRENLLFKIRMAEARYDSTRFIHVDEHTERNMP